MTQQRILAACFSVMLLPVVTGYTAFADLLLYEGFDIPVGSLQNQAGATSFGFDPVFGTVWDSGIFGSPDVAAGSIAPPPSVVGFQAAPSAGNRYWTTGATVTGRNYELNAPHFYGSFLTTTSLHASGADALYQFQNFQLRAVNQGSGSYWRMDSYGFFDTGVDADGTTLVLWELEFNQTASLLPDTFKIWFNKNPLTDAPDFEDSTVNLGLNNLGGGGALAFHSNLFLGLSSLEIDELRIGTDWRSVGVNSVPEPGALICLLTLSIGVGLWNRRSRHAAAPANFKPNDADNRDFEKIAELATSFASCGLAITDHNTPSG